MPESFGARLRQRRERQQIALTSIAEQTKISLSLLEALERDDVSHWPAGIFRRAFIRTRRPARAVGRVVRDGVPAAGVRVVVVPALAQFAVSGDVTELRGGETETDPDGRFTISLAPRGSGELRVGDERGGVRRACPLVRPSLCRTWCRSGRLS